MKKELTQLEINFLNKYRDTTIYSKYIAKKILKIKNKILTQNELPAEDEDRCFCGGEFERKPYIINAFTFIDSIE